MSEEKYTPTVGDVWFRYNNRTYSIVVDADCEMYGTRTALECENWAITRITPKGVWLTRALRGGLLADLNASRGRPENQPILVGEARFVLLNSRRKFAAPTEILALESFLARKAKQARILRSRLTEVEGLIGTANARIRTISGKKNEPTPEFEPSLDGL